MQDFDANQALMEPANDPRLGAVRPPYFDARELPYAFAAAASATAADLSKEVSLRRWIPHIKDQGVAGSCVAQALSSAIETLQARLNETYATGRSVIGLNRNYIYRLAREMRGWQNQDFGCVPSDACDVSLGGVPREDLWPYRPGLFSQPVPDFVRADAPNQDFMLSHNPIYASMQARENIWHALNEGIPVLVSMTWNQRFYAPIGGILPTDNLPTPTADMPGHSVFIWKHRADGTWVCSNSWGESYGYGALQRDAEAMPGTFLMPQALLDMGYIWDMRAINPEKVSGPPAPGPGPVDPLPATTKLQAIHLALQISAQFQAQGDLLGWHGAESARLSIEAYVPDAAIKRDVMQTAAHTFWWFKGKGQDDYARGALRVYWHLDAALAPTVSAAEFDPPTVAPPPAE